MKEKRERKEKRGMGRIKREEVEKRERRSERKGEIVKEEGIERGGKEHSNVTHFENTYIYSINLIINFICSKFRFR